MELSNLESYPALIEALPAHLTRLLQHTENGMQTRQQLDLHVTREARKLMHDSPCVVVAALGYMIAREKDLRRLFAIIQGRLLELDQALIEEAVIGRTLEPVLERAS